MREKVKGNFSWETPLSKGKRHFLRVRGGVAHRISKRVKKLSFSGYSLHRISKRVQKLSLPLLIYVINPLKK